MKYYQYLLRYQMRKIYFTIYFSLFLWINECSIITHQNWGYGSELDFRNTRRDDYTNLNMSVYPIFHKIVREKYGKVIIICCFYFRYQMAQQTHSTTISAIPKLNINDRFTLSQTDASYLKTYRNQKVKLIISKLIFFKSSTSSSS